MLNIIKSLTLLVVLLSVVACSKTSTKPNIEVIQNMMESPATKAQEGDPTMPSGRAMLLPPEHTIPVGFQPYRYAGDAEASANNVNPIAGQMTQEVLSVGQKYFDTNCAVCHGFEAKGDGTVAAKMPLKPPTLHSDKVKNWKDGRIYHVITEGQGVMGAHASHIPQAYRWQVVNYIRFLQKNNQ